MTSREFAPSPLFIPINLNPHCQLTRQRDGISALTCFGRGVNGYLTIVESGRRRGRINILRPVICCTSPSAPLLQTAVGGRTPADPRPSETPSSAPVRGATATRQRWTAQPEKAKVCRRRSAEQSSRRRLCSSSSRVIGEAWVALVDDH